MQGSKCYNCNVTVSRTRSLPSRMPIRRIAHSHKGRLATLADQRVRILKECQHIWEVLVYDRNHVITVRLFAELKGTHSILTQMVLIIMIQTTITASAMTGKWLTPIYG